MNIKSYKNIDKYDILETQFDRNKLYNYYQLNCGKDIEYQEAKFYLYKILNDKLTIESIYDKIDYQKIFYIAYLFREDEEIQKLITELNKKIYNFYKYKKNMLEKLNYKHGEIKNG